MTARKDDWTGFDVSKWIRGESDLITPHAVQCKLLR
jgi:hypothetical protein